MSNGLKAFDEIKILKMNGDAIREILREMTGETVVNAKGIFEPEK